MNNARTVWGIGLTTIAGDGTVLDAWFSEVSASEIDAADAGAAAETLQTMAGVDDRRNVRTELVQLRIDLDEAPASTADVYLRLHALSHLVVRPNELNLDGIFAHLPNVAWTTAGPMLPADAARLRPVLQRHSIQVRSEEHHV